MKRMAQFILKFINLIDDLMVQYIFARLYIALFLHVALNNLINKLDERSKRNETSGTKRMGFLRHEQRIITDSSFSGIPPIDSPSWAIATCSSIWPSKCLAVFSYALLQCVGSHSSSTSSAHIHISINDYFINFVYFL